ncbi:MAG: hypothetical protein KME35_17675 [Aphanocapsa sp. GSE-SYN-MK-11-07L]|jgi:hypothetical protein|nr:hypothetical protein [Aphanocapsa sp. GSE-SYN-MK-11-07L]
MASINCPACHQQVGNHAPICPHCGSRLERSRSPQKVAVKLVITFSLLAMTVGIINTLFSETYKQFEKATSQPRAVQLRQACSDQTILPSEQRLACRKASLDGAQLSQ